MKITLMCFWFIKVKGEQAQKWIPYSAPIVNAV